MANISSLIPSTEILQHKGYRNYLYARILISGARQMVAVAIGWQVYDLARETRSIEESAFLLGMIGLTMFLPVLTLSLYGGQVADRFNRKTILVIATVVRIGVMIGLLVSTYMATALALQTIFCLAAVLGIVNAFFPAAAGALYPNLIPLKDLHQAIAWNSLGFQLAAITGPAIGGFLFIGGLALVYGVAATFASLALLFLVAIQAPKQSKKSQLRGWQMIKDGLTYVRDNKVVLGAISLDLIVVLFGGVTALLPVFARDILQVGAEGLGYLRAAPAIGALAVAFYLALRPFNRHVGRNMLIAIVIYGLAILGFGLSKFFWLSMLMLAITGAADMISVYVRASLIQMATPDEMRGRVSSISFIFISASNELGEFESGVAARFLGPIGAVILGGTVALLTALSWPFIFPKLSQADHYNDIAAPENKVAMTEK
ncbi:MAG: MFS transporter [Bacteroidota bacterium]